MASGKLYDSNINALLQNSSLDCSSKVLESLWYPNSSSNCNVSKVDYLESVKGKGNADRLSCPLFDKDDNSDEEFDEFFKRPGKKRRLSADQVQFLERNFENENKLDPERKFQFAKELGLQPRQVAIWFQNRRARSKTKQLEKEHDCLRAIYDKLKDDYESLLKDNEKMKNEVRSLKDKLPITDSGEENQEHICRNANNSANSESQNQDANGVPDTVANAPPVAWKQEDASSGKSDAFDTDGLHYSDGKISSFLEPAYSSNIFQQDNNSTFLEPAYSSNVFESEQSDFSQDDGDNFSMSLLQTPYCPKLEDGVSDLCFPVEDQFFCFWP